MNKLYNILQVKEREIPIFKSFAVFNLLLYSGIFLGRAIRDALFFSNIESSYLPFIFMANALCMFFFGRYFSSIISDAKNLKRNGIILFILSLVCIILFYLSFAYQIISSEKLILLFYIVSEIIFFVMIVFIWVVGEQFITESMGQRLNPKIIAGGHIGIVIGGTMALLPAFTSLTINSLFIILIVIIICQIFSLVNIYSKCDPLVVTKDISYYFKKSENLNGESNNIISDFTENVKLIKKDAFVKSFAIFTICNFFLIGCNDYMLNFGTEKNEINSDLLILYLGIATIIFGLLSSFVQVFWITNLIKSKGIPFVNRLAAWCFFFGFLLLLTTTELLFPIKKYILLLFHLKDIEYFLIIIIFVRFLGYLAEYLVNQTVIPSIYMAMKDSSRERVRTFIEGTLVQAVFGISGIFLLGYNYIFNGNLDLLILIGLLVSIVMLFIGKSIYDQYRDAYNIRLNHSNIFLKENSNEAIRNIPFEQIRRKLNSSISDRSKSFTISNLDPQQTVNFQEDILMVLRMAKPENKDNILVSLINLNSKSILNQIIDEIIRIDIGNKLSILSNSKTLELFLNSLIKTNSTDSISKKITTSTSFTLLSLKQLNIIYDFLRKLEFLEIDLVLKIQDQINKRSKEVKTELPKIYTTQSDFALIVNNLKLTVKDSDQIPIHCIDLLNFLRNNYSSKFEIVSELVKLVQKNSIYRNEFLKCYFNDNISSILKYPIPEILKDVSQIDIDSIKQNQSFGILDSFDNSNEISLTSFIKLIIIDRGQFIDPMQKSQLYKLLYYKVKKIEKNDAEIFLLPDEVLKNDITDLLIACKEYSVHKNNLRTELIKKEITLREENLFYSISLNIRGFDKIQMPESFINFKSPLIRNSDLELSKLEQILSRDDFKIIDQYTFASTLFEKGKLISKFGSKEEKIQHSYVMAKMLQ